MNRYIGTNNSPNLLFIKPSNIDILSKKKKDENNYNDNLIYQSINLGSSNDHERIQQPNKIFKNLAKSNIFLGSNDQHEINANNFLSKSTKLSPVGISGYHNNNNNLKDENIKLSPFLSPKFKFHGASNNANMLSFNEFSGRKSSLGSIGKMIVNNHQVLPNISSNENYRVPSARKKEENNLHLEKHADIYHIINDNSNGIILSQSSDDKINDMFNYYQMNKGIGDKQKSKYTINYDFNKENEDLVNYKNEVRSKPSSPKNSVEYEKLPSILNQNNLQNSNLNVKLNRINTANRVKSPHKSTPQLSSNHQSKFQHISYSLQIPFSFSEDIPFNNLKTHVNFYSSWCDYESVCFLFSQLIKEAYFFQTIKLFMIF